jgi:hypothetical protein
VDSGRAERERLMVTVSVFGLEAAQQRQRYDQLFEDCPHAFIQQSTYWAEVIQDMGPDRPIFLLAEVAGEAVGGLPLYLYEHALGNVLISVPHPGPLGGIFVRAGLPPATLDAVYAALLEQALSVARAQACLALTVMTNPFEDDLARYQRHLAPEIVFENFTQYMPLEEVVAEDGRIRLRDYERRSNLSRNLRAARTAGFTVQACETEADLEALYAVHVQRHQELEVEPFPRALIENIQRQLVPRGKALLLLVKDGEAVASSCIYLYHRQVLDVLRLTRDSRYATQGPNFLNTEFSLKWARRQGVRIYNWQSSSRREDGVYRYKTQWGGRETPFYYVTRLLCPPGQIAALGLDRLKADYAGHFVVPYAAFDQGFQVGYYKK